MSKRLGPSSIDPFPIGLSPVDWAFAERVALKISNRVGTVTGPLPRRDDVEPFVAEAEALVARETGLHPSTRAAVEVIGRDEWVMANLASFRRLLQPTIERWTDNLSRHENSRTARPGWSVAAKVTGFELGAMLGWASGRVLGQYDVLVAADALAGEVPAAGATDAVYLVAPNIAALEQKFGFDPAQFRFWVTLHELTHRAQFRGVPWMHEHYLGLVSEALTIANPEPGHFVRRVREAWSEREVARQRLDEGGAIALLATDAQRTALGRIGGLMALLEGHGDATMDRAAGADRLPQAARFGHVLRARRHNARPVTRALHKLLGLEAKLNQYAAGQRFLTAIEASVGPRAVDMCWQRPSNLPSLDEVREPGRWVARVTEDTV